MVSQTGSVFSVRAVGGYPSDASRPGSVTTAEGIADEAPDFSAAAAVYIRISDRCDLIAAILGRVARMDAPRHSRIRAASPVRISV